MITIIAAVAADGAIGRRGDLLWHIPEDLRHFKSLTLGAPVIMGRLTWESLPKRPLPKRLNIVVTHDPAYDAPGAEVASSLAEAIEIAKASRASEGNPDGDIFIIGGGRIYAAALPLADRLELTEIDAVAPDADTFFPPFKAEEWQREVYNAAAHNGLRYRFVKYQRLKPKA
ncbi:MAG: dihydrofolate reductase [Muribaculaceae bacterium]|nr:dihydrofolate reductase [Muribaculaceae bacterium]